MQNKTKVKFTEESATTHKLLSFLHSNRIEIDPTALNLLLTACDAPLSLDKLFLPLSALPEIFSAVKKISSSSRLRPIRSKVERIEPTLRTLLSHQNEILIAFPRLGKAIFTSRNKTLERLAGGTLLYKMLGSQPFEEDLFQRYAALKAQALVARWGLETSALWNSGVADNAYLEIRKLAAKEKIYELRTLPQEPLPPGEYFQEIQKRTIDYDLIRNISLLLEILLQKIKPKRANDSRVESAVIEPFDNIHPQESQEPEKCTKLFVRKTRSEPEEIESSLDINFLGDFKDAEGASKQIAKDNQLFWFDWSELSNKDIGVLLSAINGALPESSVSPGKFKDLILSRACLNLMFWTGLSVDTLKQLRVSFFADPVAEMTYCYPKGVVRLTSKGAILTRKKSSYTSEKRIPNQEYIDLALPEGAREAINQFCLAQFPVSAAPAMGPSPSIKNHQSQQPEDTKLFLFDGRKLHAVCQTFVSSLRKKGTYRLTLARIRNFHYRRLARHPFGDVTTAALALGRSSEFLAETKIHYASFWATDLAKMFNQSTHDIITDAGGTEPPPPLPPSNHLHLGTPFRLREDVVVTTARALKESVETARKEAKSREGIVAFHNVYTAYTVFLFSFAAGHRRSGLPVISYSSWDDETGFACIRDKDTTDFYHSRLLWLPQDCRVQLKNYLSHLRVLNVSVDSENKDKTQEFFFINSGLVADSSLSTYSDTLKAHGYDFPGHPQRHFLKSELQERGCSPAVVELFLGHWNLGQEGWCKTSALHPEDYRRELEAYLPDFLERLELTPVPGLRKKPPRIQLPIKFKDKRKGQEIRPPDEPPHQVWVDASCHKGQWQDSFTQDEKEALSILYRSMPQLYAGQADVDPAALDRFFRKLRPSKLPHVNCLRRHNFIRNGLQAGQQSLGWSLQVPKEPKILPKGINRVRPERMKQLNRYRELERVFLDSLKDPLPQHDQQRIGQILMSAILFGGVLDIRWVQALLDGLLLQKEKSRIFQFGDWLWVDFWVREQSTADENSREYFRSQSDPDKFRRWFPDPLTQLLIYRWLNDQSEQRDKHLKRGQPWKILQKTIRGLRKKSRRDRRTKKTLSFSITNFGQLRILANSRYTLTIPSFLAEYAANTLPSASLPDPIWLRSISGRVVPVKHKRRLESTVPPPVSLRQYAEGSEKIQKNMLKEIRKRIVEKTEGGKENQTEKIRKGIEEYLVTHQDSISPILNLLGQWAIQLLEPEKFPWKRKNKKAYAIRTVFQYLEHIGDGLIDICGNRNPLEFRLESYITLYQLIVEKIEGDSEAIKRKRKNQIDRLRQFHGFLVDSHFQPFVDVRTLFGKEKLSQQISANLITEKQFRVIRKRLGWGQALDRNQRMTLLALIIGYRTGLRKEEFHGLLIEDVQVGPR